MAPYENPIHAYQKEPEMVENTTTPFFPGILHGIFWEGTPVRALQLSGKLANPRCISIRRIN